MQSETETASDKAVFRPARWVGVWVVFLAVHAALMATDWQLRDPLAPIEGGLPEIFGVLGWSSLILLGIAVFIWMPRSWAVWLRFVLSLLQVGLAYAILTFSWLYYVLSNGIDTL